MEKPYLHGLDPDQRRAVLSASMRVLVVAAPGSGKTRVLVSRLARLMDEGVDPSAILAVTFTNRAGREMAERVAGLSPANRSLNIGTFHSFCLKVVKGDNPSFVLYGREEAEKTLKDLGVKDAAGAASRISYIKNTLAKPAAEEEETLKLYAERLRRENALDMDDLITEAAKILEGGSAPVFSHILVDEYQDINPAQERLLKALSRESALFAIGDPDQSIYAFRGSDLGAFLRFEKDCPGTEVVRLSRNYRSAGLIVEASGRLITHNASRADNRPLPVKGGGDITLVECADERAEADHIVSEIERMMGGLSSLSASAHMDGARFSDFAVLYRTNGQARALAGAFGRSRVPFAVIGDRAEGFVQFLGHLRAQEFDGVMPLKDFIVREGKALNVNAGVVEAFSRIAAAFEERTGPFDYGAFLDEASLLDPSDDYDIEADRVSLMTIHAAKGLEFRVVFIAGVEKGLIPFERAGSTVDLEEERRLFYVGMTRAKERLYLLHPGRRALWGEARETVPSPFLKEIPVESITRSSAGKKKTKKRPEQKGLFD